MRSVSQRFGLLGTSQKQEALLALLVGLLNHQ